MQEDLLKTEEGFRLAFENAKDAIFWADTETGILVYCNKAAEILLQKNRDEIIGQHQATLHPPEKAGYYSNSFKKHVKENGVVNSESEIITKSGKIISVHITASVFSINGRSLIQGIFRDITERKRIENALKESKERFRSITSGAPIVIFGEDKNGVITFAEGKGLDALGFNKPELIGKSVYDVFPGQPWVEKNIRRVLSGEEFTSIVEVGGIYFETHYSPIKDKSGEVIGLVGVAVDITERKQAEKELELLNKKLLQSNRKLKQLALRDSHTGLYNHHYLPEVLESEFYRARRYDNPVSLIMLDIDYFKSINDVYGHYMGDLVLQQFSRLLKKLVNRYDIVIRFGGEEFVIILPGTNRPSALELSQKILNTIRLYNFGDKKNAIKLRLSIAVSSYPEDRIFKALDLIKNTDQLLNKVKEDGGDKVYSSIDTEKAERAVLEKEESSDIKFLRDKIDRLSRRANQSLFEAIFAFAKTIKLKDYYTGEHVEKTVNYAADIARVCGLSQDEIENTRKAAMLHDIGKIGISDKILLKKSSLSKAEFGIIKKHPQIGVDIIRPIKSLYPILPLILYHHERWDGKGYPTGLKGEEIPIGARIISIADAYQALISNRPYRKAYSKNKAVEIIKKGTGTQFDPEICRIFLKILSQKNK